MGFSPHYRERSTFSQLSLYQFFEVCKQLQLKRPKLCKKTKTNKQTILHAVNTFSYNKDKQEQTLDPIKMRKMVQVVA